MRKLIFVVPLIAFVLAFAVSLCFWVEPAAACAHYCPPPYYFCVQSQCLQSGCLSCGYTGSCWVCLD